MSELLRRTSALKVPTREFFFGAKHEGFEWKNNKIMLMF